jgi:hypothetical protein
MGDDPDRDLDLSPAMLAELEENMRLFAERSEKNPWTQGLRAVLAIGDQGLIDDFVKRFKADEARRWPKQK